MKQRTDAMVNGALIALGCFGILDNVVFHWLLELHRAIPGPHALKVELALVAASVVLLLLGVGREYRVRKNNSATSR